MGKGSMLVGFVGLLMSCAWAESVFEEYTGTGWDKDFELTGLESRSTAVLRGGRKLLQNSGVALLGAAQSGDSSGVQGLLDAGADPNYEASDGIGFPLAVAAVNDHVDVIRILLSAGATVGLRNSKGVTALEYAAVNGVVGAVRALLAAGANPNEFDDEGYNPIHRASAEGHTEVVQELVNAGGDISLRTGGTTSGDTALHIAARRSHLGVVRLLLRSGADPNSRNSRYGQSPLHRAAVSGSGSVLLALIDAGAGVNQVTASGDSALFVAALFGQREAIEVLLEKGADKSLASNDGATPREALCICTFASEIPDDCQVEECSDSPQRMISLLNP